MRLAAATGRGNFSASGNNPERPRAPVSAAALTGRRNSLRAALRSRSAHPTRFARGGVMPVQAKHTAVPEAQVRHPNPRFRRASSFLRTDPRIPRWRTRENPRPPRARAIAARVAVLGFSSPPHATREKLPRETHLTELDPPPRVTPSSPPATAFGWKLQTSFRVSRVAAIVFPHPTENRPPRRDRVFSTPRTIATRAASVSWVS